MMREISDSPFPRCEARAYGSDSSLVLKAAACAHRAKAHCSALDSIETKENSAVKIPALAKSTVSPLLPRKLDFANCQEDLSDEEESPAKEFRRPRTNASTHQEKRFKGVTKVVPKVALELFHQKMKASLFFRCFEEEQVLLPRIAEVLEKASDQLFAGKKLDVLVSFYLSRKNDERLLALWAPEVRKALKELTWTQVAKVNTVYGVTSHKELMQDVENHTLRHIPLIATTDLCTMCSTMSLVLPMYKRKLLRAFEQEVVARTATERLSGSSVAKILKGLSDRIDAVATVLEPQVKTSFTESDLALTMYHLGANGKGSASTWQHLTSELLALGEAVLPRTIAQGVYGAYYGGFRSEEFYHRMADRVVKKRLTVKEAEKLIPVYANVKRVDVLTACRDLLLRDYKAFTTMRALTLINFYMTADQMVPELSRLMLKLKGKE